LATIFLLQFIINKYFCWLSKMGSTTLSCCPFLWCVYLFFCWFFKFPSLPKVALAGIKIYSHAKYFVKSCPTLSVCVCVCVCVCLHSYVCVCALFVCVCLGVLRVSRVKCLANNY